MLSFTKIRKNVLWLLFLQTSPSGLSKQEKSDAIFMVTTASNPDTQHLGVSKPLHKASQITASHQDLKLAPFNIC